MLELAWLSKDLDPALHLYRWASSTSGSNEKQVIPPSTRLLAELFTKLQLSIIGIQDWSFSDLTVGLYLFYLSQASGGKIEEIRGVQINSEVAVVNLQAQLTSLKVQAAIQDFGGTTSSPQQEQFYNNYSPYQQDGNCFIQNQNSVSNPSTDGENMMYYENGLLKPECTRSSQNCNAYSNLSDELVSYSADDSSSCEMRPVYSDMEDLHSVAFDYLYHT